MRDAFVGRASELQAMRDSWQSARSGHPAVVVVEGEPGIGKTALVRRFSREVDEVAVLWASGEESESALEYGVINQLSMALPATTTARPGTDSFAVGADLLAGIGEQEHSGPVLVVIDDLHWADLPSARALLFCLRRLRADCVMVLLVARTHALDRLGEGWVRLLADGDVARWIRLTGLTTSEVAELAAAGGRALTRSAGERLRDHTSGNPLYLRALLCELPSDALHADGPHLPAPHSYAATVLARLTRLSSPARELVSAAATVGVHCPDRIAAAMAGLTDARAAVDEAADARLVELRFDGAATEIAFRHPLDRAAVYDDLSPTHRRRLHLQAAAELAPPASYRHRVIAATGAVDAQLAAELAAAAADEQRAGALNRAAEYLIGAFRVDPEPTSADEALFRAVELLLLAGDVATAQGYASTVAARPDGPYRRYTSTLIGTPTTGLDRSADELRAIVEGLSSEQDPVLYARCGSALAYLSAIIGDGATTVTWAERARRAAPGAPTVESMCRQALAWAHAKAGRLDASLALVADGDASRPQPVAFEAELVAIRGVVHAWAGRYDVALRDLRAVVRWVQLGFPVTDVVLVYASMAEAEFHIGAWDAAATHAELAVSLAEDLDHLWYLPNARSVAAHLYAARGDDAFAATHSASARRAGPAVGDETWAYQALARAWRAWGVSDWAEVCVALAPFDTPAAARVAGHPSLAVWRTLLAEAYLAAGRIADARRVRAQIRSERWGGTTPADLARLTAMLCYHAGDVDGAARAFDEGMDRVDPATVSLSDGLLALECGRFRLRTKKRKSAVEPLVAARSVFRRLGAARYATAAESTLAACGVTTAPVDTAPTSAREALTAREQVVARMVAMGLTNREVAAQLFLSVKAVEYHLGNIFGKLDIRSRHQLRDTLGLADRPADPSDLAAGLG